LTPDVVVAAMPDPRGPSVGGSLGLKLTPAIVAAPAASVDVIGFLGFQGLRAAHITGNLIVLAPMLGVSAMAATRGLARIHSVSHADDLLGGMWAVVATVFVYRDTYAQHLAAAVSRTAATSISFARCLAYLLVLPFHASGLAALSGVGALGTMLHGRPEDTVTTGITTAVVMVVAAYPGRSSKPCTRKTFPACATCSASSSTPTAVA
jgi:uncharacterized membrane protein YoaK (UPF0700 family)